MKIEIDEQALARCGHYLHTHNLKLLCAESMTAGFLGSMWALELESGHYFLGSVVCYDDSMKTILLQVPGETIERYTAESKEVTLCMLDGLKKYNKADVHISITGLAFESTNPKQKRPIGTVYYAFYFQNKQTIYERHFEGNAGEIIIASCNSIYDDLYQWLNKITTYTINL